MNIFDWLGIKLKSLWWKLEKFLDDHQSLKCPSCRDLFYKKDMDSLRLTNGENVWFCKPCKEEMFTPFSKSQTVMRKGK